ncbi:hypothetical protein [Streptomyces sp. NPDC101132]|uniref:hypothetical protein n=1 Tax=Streptomyces sp. NPDC101132 TaxID=3366110 RepID=UPI0038009328
MPTVIDADRLPALAGFAAHEGIDGPEAVTRIRNRLVHPEGAQEKVYRIEGLVLETWLLVRHYLSLIILQSLGYRGRHQELARMGGWAGEVAETPWA